MHPPANAAVSANIQIVYSPAKKADIAIETPTVAAKKATPREMIRLQGLNIDTITAAAIITGKICRAKN